MDNRQYAIKRIPLPARSRQLYKKMTREVELLSRLNHENVVRYFNSWIEIVNEADFHLMDQLLASGDASLSQESSIKTTKSPVLQQIKSKSVKSFTSASNPKNKRKNSKSNSSSSSSSWDAFMPHVDVSDDSDDGIEFVDSNGQIAVYDDDSNEDEEDDDDDDDEEDNDTECDVNHKINKAKTNSNLKCPGSSKPMMLQIMYIQMEFCEKCTLRTAIDDNLYENSERLWRLFREIAEGLSHIHQQGIIHRDLKPVNIFLDSRDQIKIGDFGLATTSFLALQSPSGINENNQNSTAVGQGLTTITSASIDEVTGGTGLVGTTLYVAPELTGNASKSVYNQKVDMFTLGIILFEMCLPPFGTAMERVQTIVNLRTPKIVLPEVMITQSNKYEKTIKVAYCEYIMKPKNTNIYFIKFQFRF